MPDATSLPDHDTGNIAVASIAGSVATALTGGVTSMVFSQVGVPMGALASKTTVARLAIWVPVVRLLLGLTVKVTLPWPSTPLTSGGRKPTVGSLGGNPVLGSIEVNVHLSRPVSGFTPP